MGNNRPLWFTTRLGKIGAASQKLAREAEGLRQSLESLRKQEVARADEVATLPTSEAVSRVASRLEEQVTGNREQVTGNREQVTGNREQVTGQRHLDPLTRPALAEESASAGHPLPYGGEGLEFLHFCPLQQCGEGQKCLAAIKSRKQPAPDTEPLAPYAWPPSSPALVLSDQGVRKVETAFAVEDFAGGFIAGVDVR